MNKQLLEDIGESQYPPPPMPGSPGGQPKVQAGPKPAPEPAAPTAGAAFKVWRHGKAPEEEPEQTFTDRPDPTFTFAPQAEPAPPVAPPSWFERWGRRAAITTISFVGVAMVCFGAFSVYQDKADEKTLTLLATTAPRLPAKAPLAQRPAAPAAPAEPAPAVAAPAVPAAPAPAAPPAPVAAAKAPALVMLQDEPAPAPAPAPPKKLLARMKPAVAKAPERIVDDARPMSPFSTLLKECRARGYHAEQCIKRACVLTKYGLACKG